MAHKSLLTLVFLAFIFNSSNSQPANSCPIKCRPDQVCLPSPSGKHFACVDNQAKPLPVGSSHSSQMIGLMQNGPMAGAPIPNGQMAPIQSARMGSGPINAPIMNGPARNSPFSGAPMPNGPMSGAPIRMGNGPVQNGPIPNGLMQNEPISGAMLSSGSMNQPSAFVQHRPMINSPIPPTPSTETRKSISSGSLSPVRESAESAEVQVPSEATQNQQSSEFDPCLSNPCSFGNICIRTTFGFKCQKEVDLTPEISDAREVYRMLEEAYRKGIVLNMDTIKSMFGPIRVKTPDNSIIQLKVKRPSSNSTESNVCLETDVCEEGTECQVDDESETGFVCVKTEEQLITGDDFTKIVVKTDEPSSESAMGQWLSENVEQSEQMSSQESQMSQETQVAQEQITPEIGRAHV